MKIDRIIKELFRQSIGLPEVNSDSQYEVEVIYLNQYGRLSTTMFYIGAAQYRKEQESVLRDQWMEFYKDNCYTVDAIVEMNFKEAA